MAKQPASTDRCPDDLSVTSDSHATSSRLARRNFVYQFDTSVAECATYRPGGHVMQMIVWQCFISFFIFGTVLASPSDTQLRRRSLTLTSHHTFPSPIAGGSSHGPTGIHSHTNRDSSCMRTDSFGMVRGHAVETVRPGTVPALDATDGSHAPDPRTGRDDHRSVGDSAGTSR